MYLSVLAHCLESLAFGQPTLTASQWHGYPNSQLYLCSVLCLLTVKQTTQPTAKPIFFFPRTSRRLHMARMAMQGDSIILL